jgi:alpha/beta superfamily hydrolase
MPRRIESLFLDGPAGRLEALLEEPEEAEPVEAAVVCHPHPQYGGTMHNHATYRLARAVRGAGGSTLRFNYRGVGRSAGSYDGGRGEALDARAALAHLRRLDPGLPLLCAGFSFGAWVSVACSDEPGLLGLLLAGLPIRSAEVEGVRLPGRLRELALPVAVVQAEGDEYATPAEVRELLAGSTGPRRLAGVPGTTHLFDDDLPALEREAGEALSWLLAGAAARPEERSA